MKLTSFSALITTLALVFSLASPPRAQALSAGEITLIVVGSLTGFVIAVVVGTFLTRDESKVFLVEPPPEEDTGERRITVGLECRGPDGVPALICW